MKKALKVLYDLLPFKHQVFSVIKFFWTPKESVFKHLSFKGVMNVRIADSKSFKLRHYGFQIENEIFWQGIVNGWEKESLKLWIQLTQDAGTILDIGANTGVYALLAKAINPNSKVFAFEPVNRVFQKLQANIELNHFDITAIEKAVSDTDGIAVIYDQPSEHIYSVTVNKNLSASSTKVIETKISTITLNHFIKERNIGNVDLIKIDVETHEAEVLEGFSEYLGRFKPTILIEILNKEVGEKCDSILNKFDYLYFHIDEETGARQMTKIIPMADSYNYLICSSDTARKLNLVYERQAAPLADA